MKTTNFEFVDLIYLRHADTDYDLHNDYSFEIVRYSVAKRTVVLKWVGGQPNRDLPPIPTTLELEFSDVQFFSFSPRDPDMPFTEDDCLEMTGYSDGTIDTDFGPYIEDNDEGSLHWRFDFHSGAKIVIGASHATVSINP